MFVMRRLPVPLLLFLALLSTERIRGEDSRNWEYDFAYERRGSPPPRPTTPMEPRETIVVTTLLEPPYMMLKTEGAFLAGNDRFEGFLADILSRLADVLRVNYEIRLTRDGKIGGPGENGTWNGMLGEVIRGEADLAAGPLTVSEERRLMVDFTKPYMAFRSTALLKKPKRRRDRIKTAQELLSSPYSYGVIEGSIAQELFSLSGNATYSRMWARMNTFWPPALVQSVPEGLARARNEEYAFILDTPAAEYVASRRPCDLYTIEPFLDRRHYALVVRKGDERLAAINAAIQSFTDSQELQLIYMKWWQGECYRNHGNRATSRPRGVRNGKPNQKTSEVTTEMNSVRQKTYTDKVTKAGNAGANMFTNLIYAVLLTGLLSYSALRMS